MLILKREVGGLAAMSSRPSILFVGLLALVVQAMGADSLSFNNNWFTTGDYVVAGVGLRGTGVNGVATGTINVPALPTGAEPIAAFLYWSTIEFVPAPSASDGYFNGYRIRGTVLGNPQNPGCWSSGGTTGPSGSGATGRSYRADVLRYIPVNSSNIRQASGAHTVKLPDGGGSGNGNVVYTNGASLVVIYRVVIPGSPLAAPLRAVVSYNGAFTMDKPSAGMTQTLAGFYQASGGTAKVTYIVANGQSDFSSPLSVNGTTLSSNPFTGAQGGRWDNPTINFTLPSNAASFDTLVTTGNNQTCLTFVAAFASMNVPDSDNDGLLDFWETNGLHRNTTVSPATFGGCGQYPNEPQNCVNLPAMGASLNQRDIFVQLDWMSGYGDNTGGLYGNGYHNHAPKRDALLAVCKTFAGQGIKLHFDVGNLYQGDDCIVPKAYAQGGSSVIDESTLLCRDTPTHTCTYHTPYPVLSFEFGFASVRDGNKKANPQIPAHFAQARKDTHHYGLFAHALAGPFNALGQPVDPYTLRPATTPRSYSGIAQRPGGGFMVTLGMWRSDIPDNDQVGSSGAQAGTLMHELGHNLGLGHMGLLTKPNCAPNYQSVMNYAYQTRLLTGSDGLSHVDYSSGSVTNLSETVLGPLSNLRYRVRYYGPLGSSAPAGAAAKLHCDGTPIMDNALAVRLEGPTVGTPDWSNGTGVTSFDVNFDGLNRIGVSGSWIPGQTFSDQPDWTSLNLQQIGTGPRFGALSVGAWATDGGVFATDGGALATDAGALATDGGVFATDGGAFATDGGAFATDGGVFATDGGALATDGGAYATDAGDEDYETHNASGPDAPTGLTATNRLSDILLAWSPPGNGTAASYDIYRCAGAAGCSSPKAFHATGGLAAPTFIDTVNNFVQSGASCPAGDTCYNTTYTYQVLATVMTSLGSVASPLSNSASGIVKHLFIKANDQSRVYGSATLNSADFTTTGQYPDSPNQLTGTTTCTTTASSSSPVGTYPITCSGLTPTAGVTYTAGTLTITKANATIVVTPYSVTYDGNPHTAIGTATGVGGVDLSASLNLTDTTHTNAGDYPSDAWSFSGGTNYNDAGGTVHDAIAKANSTTKITSASPEPSIVGGPVVVSVTVTPASGGTVTVTESGATPANCTVTLAAGAGSCTLTPTVVGNKTLTATYAGDSNTNGSSGTAPHQVKYDVQVNPLKSPANLGSSVPVNFQVKNALGGIITDLSIVQLIESVKGLPVSGVCVASNTGMMRQTLYSIPNGSTGKSSLRTILSPPSDQFNWDTSTATVTGSGCYTVVITLIDGNPNLSSPVLLQ